ncbi:hypothetical protein BMR02_00995 [Methylococcaceae bacterium HT1]|nr:hypothetical protein BMR02_00995 [Methylococcaceae bacterium HT1]
MEFTPRGENIWVSVRDDNRVVIYDTNSFKEITRIPANKPSGIFLALGHIKWGYEPLCYQYYTNNYSTIFNKNFHYLPDLFKILPIF